MCHLIPSFAPPLQLHLPSLLPPLVFVISTYHLFIILLYSSSLPPYPTIFVIQFLQKTCPLPAPLFPIQAQPSAVLWIASSSLQTPSFGHILTERRDSCLFACISAGASASAVDFTVNCSSSLQVLRAGRSAHPALLPAPASIIIAVADKANALPALAPLPLQPPHSFTLREGLRSSPMQLRHAFLPHFLFAFSLTFALSPLPLCAARSQSEDFT